MKKAKKILKTKDTERFDSKTANMLEDTTKKNAVDLNFNTFKPSGTIENETEEDSFEDRKVKEELSEAKSGNRDTGQGENELLDKIEPTNVKPVTREEFVMLMAEFREQSKADREEIFKDFWKKDEDG